jgi:hypothetical protein
METKSWVPDKALPTSAAFGGFGFEVEMGNP